MAVTLESILERGNLNLALGRVEANGGAPGVDGMSTKELRPYLMENHTIVMEALKFGKYKPQAVRRVLIPKETKGEFRPLGIPTVMDRWIQQAIAQKLSEEYEPVFCDFSYGFRPNRGCHQAVGQCCAFASEGYTWAVDLDLAKFFDNVNHSKLLQVLSYRIKDGRVISLIDKFLKAPVFENGKITPTRKGTPQGSGVSPVLANILLNELDQELLRRGHKFVRYADDMMVLCRSRKAAERTLASLRKYIENKLFLKINEEKTKIRYIGNSGIKFLGFGFFSKKNKETGGREITPCVHAKSKAKCWQKLKKLTSRRQGISLDDMRKSIRQFVSGWVNYFAIGSISTFARRTDEWLRRRIRQMYWKVWKRTITKYRALRQLGVDREKAFEWANSRKAYWRIANSWILGTTLNNKKLRQLGWTCFADVVEYVEAKTLLATAVMPNGTSGGVEAGA